MTAGLIEARGLTAHYGASRALDGLDASIPRGEVVAVLGENGSGKSTLLKILARVLRPSGGSLEFDGRALESLPRRQTARRIAYVPQSVDLVFPIRSLDLVLQGRAPHGNGFVAETAEDFRRAREAMRACDVEALAERDASALSGGERRRVFLARALCQEAGAAGCSTSPRPASTPATGSSSSRRSGACTASGGRPCCSSPTTSAWRRGWRARSSCSRRGARSRSGPRAEVLTPENLGLAYGAPFERRGARFGVRSEVLPTGSFDL